MNSNQPNKKQYQHFLLTADKEIRQSLMAELDKESIKYPDTKIIEELGITHGAARIDIAVVNGYIHGYELKSDRDTLNRLPGQIKIYNSVLDKVTLVVGNNHIHDAIKLVPEWWGITIAKIVPPEKSVSFCLIRKSKQNPDPNYSAIAALLWREEALNILKEINEAKGMRSKTRNVIYQRLADVLDKNELKERVRQCLKTRTDWRFDPLLA